jgi:hypothetical protein
MYYKSIGNINLPFNYIVFYFRKKKENGKAYENKETGMLCISLSSKVSNVSAKANSKKEPFISFLFIYTHNHNYRK